MDGCISIFSFGLLLALTAVAHCNRDANCCEHAIEDKCRNACMRSRSYDSLATHCDHSVETDFLRCTRWGRERKRCCGYHANVTVSCHHSCVEFFSDALQNRQYSSEELKRLCPSEVFRCAKNYLIDVASYPNEGAACCDKATSDRCKADCKRILHLPIAEEEKIDNIIKSCGQPVPRKPLWKCLLSRNVAKSKEDNPATPHLHCCSQALSYNCLQLCQDLYSGPWESSKNWKKFRKWCELNPEESSLTSCLEEVEQPCKMECNDLRFCSNMNNRPSESFHSCNAVADGTARAHITEWKRGTIKLAFADIPVLDITTCQPDKWRAVACILEVKPCGVKSGGTTICRNQCMSLLRECADVRRFADGITIDWICDMFSPGHLQQDCISLDEYTVAKPSQPAGVITQPCNPNPCTDNELCVVNRRMCTKGQKCLPYTCMPACTTGNTAKHKMYVGQRVRLPDLERGKGCFRACTCTHARRMEYCSDMPCLDQYRNCEVAGQIKAHGTNFVIDCNFCSCYNGEVACTKRQCSDAEGGVATLKVLPCNCNSHHLPVCAANGRTFPNICLAKCMGYDQSEIEFGPCSVKDPCKARPCKRSEMCVKANRVCLTSTTFGCPQYECLARYPQCMRRRTRRQNYASDGHYQIGSRRLNSASRRSTSPSLLFGFDLDSRLPGPVCDVRGFQYANICHIRRKYRNSTSLSYRGKCKSRCKPGGSNEVCGIDGVTYENSCFAEAERILVDYEGSCRISTTNEGRTAQRKCSEVACSSLQHPDCITVTAPGACCPICGGMVRLLYSTTRLDSAVDHSIHGPVTVRDMIRSLRRHTEVKECDIFGHSTVEGDIAILVISTEETPTLLQIQVCQQEAARIGRLVNQQNPIIHADLILSTLTAAEIHGAKDVNQAMSVHSFGIISLVSAVAATTLIG